MQHSYSLTKLNLILIHDNTDQQPELEICTLQAPSVNFHNIQCTCVDSIVTEFEVQTRDQEFCRNE